MANQYLLTIRVPIEAMDHLDARRAARQIVKEVGEAGISNDAAKLQRVYNNKPPEKVDIWI